MNVYYCINSLKWLLEDVAPQFIGVLGALVVFYLGAKWDGRKEQSAKVQENQNQISYLKNGLYSVIEKVKDQLKYIDNYIKQIEKDNVEFHFFTLIPLSDIERVLNILKDERYFHSYNKAYSSKQVNSIANFNELFSEIDFIYAEFSQLEKMIVLAEKHDFKRKEDFKMLLDEVIALIGDALMGGEKIKAELWTEITNLYYKFMSRQIDSKAEDVASQLTYCVEELFKPINSVLIQDFQNEPAAIQAKDRVLAEKTRDGIQLYQLIQRGNILLSVELRKICNSANESVINVNKLAEI